MTSAARRLPAPTPKKLEGFQTWLGRRFPDDLLSFIQTNNGFVLAEPVAVGSRALYRFLPLLSMEQVEEFLDRSEWSAEMSGAASDIDGRLFVGDGEEFTFVPIGELSIGDYLCLDYSQTGPPGIAIWNHEESSDSAAEADRIAESFTEFLTQYGLEYLI